MDFLKKIPQIAVMLPPSVKVCRDMRKGVLRYVRTHGPWSLHMIDDRSAHHRLSDETTLYAGLIVKPNSAEEMWLASALPMPKVFVDPPQSGLRPADVRCLAASSQVCCDTAEVGRAAARHFLASGHRHFAYAGARSSDPWSVERGRAFADEVRGASFDVAMFEAPDAASPTFSDELAALCDWLLKLPKPCAVFCAWDLRARQVLDACRMADIAVPQEVAVLGVDDDEDLCLSSDPPISSIRLDSERAGYEAAQLLDGILRGETAKATVRYGPLGVVRRDPVPDPGSAGDAVVKAATEFIRLNAMRRISTADVARHCGVSSRALERRFRRQREGMTIHAYLEAVRIERVKTLLAETNEPFKAIASRSGFATVSHLTVRFRRREGLTMSEYRRRCGRMR